MDLSHFCSVDYHIHTLFSGHSASDTSISNIISRAQSIGLSRIAILEHVPPWNRPTQGLVLDNSFDSDTTIRAQIDAIIEEVEIWRPEDGPEVLVAAEVDADPNNMDGRLLLKDLSGIDLVFASTHYLPGALGIWYNNRDLPEETLKQIYENWFVWAMHIAANEVVDVLAHPAATLCSVGAIQEFSGTVLDDFAKLLAVCAKFGTAFEINEQLPRKMKPGQAESYVNLVRLAVESGVKISPGSDAHQLEKIGAYDWSLMLAEEAGVQPEHIFVPERR